MRSLPWCLPAALLAVLLAACSPGDDPSPPGDPGTGAAPDESAVHDDLAARFAGDQPGPDAQSEGECFADELLAATTLEELRAGGLLDEDDAVVDAFPELDRPLAEKVVAAQLGCTDFIDDSSRAGLYVTHGRLARERYAACLRRDLPDGAVRAAVLAAVMGSWEDPAIERLSATQIGCARRAER